MSNQAWVVDVWTPVLFCVRLPSSFLAMLLCGDCHAKFLLAVLALLHSIEVGFGRRSDVERISAAGSLREEHADVRSQSLAKSDPPDPFAGFNLYGPWTAENTGCTKTGWKGKYTIFNGQMDMLTVDVGDSSTTFAFNPDLVAQVTWRIFRNVCACFCLFFVVVFYVHFHTYNIYIYVHVKIHAYTSIFEGQPSKTRPFPIKTWGRLVYIVFFFPTFELWTLYFLIFRGWRPKVRRKTPWWENGFSWKAPLPMRR